MSLFATPEYAFFQRKLREASGIDLEAYRTQQLERRLRALLNRSGEPDLIRFARHIAEDPTALRQFIDALLINVSEFFRNPDRFDELAKDIVPILLRPGDGLSVWSAGASLGAEPYSLAMVLLEVAPGRPHRILATDIDTTALERAVDGRYDERELAGVSPERLGRFFEAVEDGWRVRSALRQMVRFERHNLLTDPFPTGLDLIVCRNVVIYFTQEAKNRVFEQFRHSLRPGGVFFVGGTESLLNARQIGFEPLRPFFYRRPELAADGSVGQRGVR